MAKKPKRNSQKRSSTLASATSIFDGLVTLAEPLINAKKEWGVEKMSEFAEATREYANSLADFPNLGGYAKAAAASFEDLVDYVNENEIDQILKDSSNFAKRHPIPMIIAGAIAGLALTQMVRADDFRLRASSKNRSAPAKKGRGSRNANNSRKANGSSHMNA